MKKILQIYSPYGSTKIKFIIVGLFLFLIVMSNSRIDLKYSHTFNPESSQQTLSSVTAKWIFNGSSSIRSSPALYDMNGDTTLDVIVGEYKQSVYVLDGISGDLLWQRDFPDSIRTSPSVGDLDNDSKPDLIMGCHNRMVYALDGEDGSIKWTFQTSGLVVASPVIVDLNDDTSIDVLVTSYDHRIYALSGIDGSLLWTTETYDWIKSSPAVGDINGDDSFEVVFGGDDKNIYALNGGDGRVIWAYQTGGPVESSPAIGDVDKDGMVDVIVGSTDKKVYSLNGYDGSFKWAFSTNGYVKSSPALGDIDGDNNIEIVIGSCDNNIYTINGEDGTLVWSYATEDWIRSSPGLADVNNDMKLDVVFGSYDNNLYALHGENGSLIWMYDLFASIDASPAIADIDNDNEIEIVACNLASQVYLLEPSNAGQRVYWEGMSGGTEFSRLKCLDFLDLDNDFLSTYTELRLSTNCSNTDTDFDLLFDGWEVHNQLDPFVNNTYDDPDYDSLPNIHEFISGSNPWKSDDFQSPIVSANHMPSIPLQNEWVTVNATILEDAGIYIVILSYSSNDGYFWNNVTMSESDQIWTGLIPPHSLGTIIYYRVCAKDLSNNWGMSDVGSYVVDDTSVNIAEITHTPEFPNSTESVEILVTVIDSSNITEVTLSYSTDLGTSWDNISMIFSDSKWSSIIPPQIHGTKVFYKVYVQDGVGNWGISNVTSYFVGDVYPPTIETTRTPQAPVSMNQVNITADVNDMSSISLVNLSYSFDLGSNWINVTMVLDDQLWTGSIPGVAANTIVQYQVYAEDAYSNSAYSDIVSYEVDDSTSPDIICNYTPASPGYLDAVTITANVTDPSGISQVLLSYSIDNGLIWNNQTMWKNEMWVSEISAQLLNATVKYKIFAEDGVGNWAITSEFSYNVTDNVAPAIDFSFSFPEALEVVVFNAIIYDESSVINVTLSYSVDKGIFWENLTMVYSNNTWTSIIPAQPFGTEVELRIYAVDEHRNIGVVNNESYIVIDTIAPIIHMIRLPVEPIAAEPQEIDSEISDVSGVTSSILFYSINNGIDWYNVTMNNSSSKWTGTIPGFSAGVIVLIQILAQDVAGNCVESEIMSYIVLLSSSTTTINNNGDPSITLTTTAGTIIGMIVLVFISMRQREK